jgi:hypothetical protein
MWNFKINRWNTFIPWMLVLLFALPFLSAYALYSLRHHFIFSTLEAGTLFSPPIQTKQLPFFEAAHLGKWQLIYIQPNLCDSDCESSISNLDAIHLSLGKESHRVKHRIIPAIQAPSLKQGEIALIDPQGWLVLRYSPSVSPKGILKDLQRLLRFSHVG